MSRELKERRRRAQRFQGMIDYIAKAEGRKLDGLSDREDYLRELMHRGVIVDMGPHPSGQGSQISFRLEGIERNLTMEQSIRLVMGGMP